VRLYPKAVLATEPCKTAVLNLACDLARMNIQQLEVGVVVHRNAAALREGEEAHVNRERMVERPHVLAFGANLRVDYRKGVFPNRLISLSYQFSPVRC